MDTELKPCPFCGEEAGICEANDICFHRDDDGNKIFGGWRCFCPSCAIEQVGYETREEAVSAWNNRSTEHATHRAPVDEKGGGRMTGIERLRKLAREQEERSWSSVGKVRGRMMLDIADQIEREQDALAADSPYDAILPEDREALSWVRDHGGIDYVKREWRSRVPHERYEARRQRLLGHIAECETALGRRNVRIDELGKTIEFLQLNNSNFRHLLADVAERLGFTRYGDDYEPEDLLDALDRRLMPEGMRWPRFESGELVRTGDEFAEKGGIKNVVSSVELSDDWFAVHGFDGAIDKYNKGERVKRPAKVLDADGVEVELGDDLYSVEGSLKFHVSHVDRANGKIATDAMFAIDKWADPSLFTHRFPVLAADGEPLEVGQTVYDKRTGDRFEVDGFSDGYVVCTDIDACESDIEILPSQLTHHRPVLDADGVPIKKGDTVYLLPGEWCDEFPCCGFHGGEELEVFADGEADHVPGGVQCREKGTGHRYTCYPQPSQLTHTKPEIDSWERIEEDKGLNPFDYCKRVGHKLWTFDNAEEFKASDLVRRCRALAERDR